MATTTVPATLVASPQPAPIVALLIPVDGPLEEVELDGTLDQLQRLVGGYIEAVPLPEFVPGSDDATAYVNEEGKLDGLPPNGRATDFMTPGVGICWGDYVVGPLLLAGFRADTGEHAALPASVVRRARLIERRGRLMFGPGPNVP